MDALLPEGEIFVSVSREGRERIYTSDENCISLPMVVLINKNTYSAAEFFAAALREYNWAAVIGQPSTGKGRSQSTFELTDGSAVHISTQRYLTPSRIDLSEQGGLTPDMTVEEEEGRDAPLESAVEYLKANREEPI